MTTDSSAIVSTAWNCAHVFKNAQVGCGEYADQHQIAAEVAVRTTAIAHLESELACQITRSIRLRKSALTSAFRGNLSGNKTKPLAS